jgi:hypothetical protein
MPTILDEIRVRLKEYPNLKYTDTESNIRVSAQTETGFDVSIYFTPDECVVVFGGWHEHFTDPKEALKCFGLGLSDDCRLKIVSRAGVECAWIAQRKTEHGWQDLSATGNFAILFLFWLPKRERFLQNQMIRGSGQSYRHDGELRDSA